MIHSRVQVRWWIVITEDRPACQTYSYCQDFFKKWKSHSVQCLLHGSECSLSKPDAWVQYPDLKRQGENQLFRVALWPPHGHTVASATTPCPQINNLKDGTCSQLGHLSFRLEPREQQGRGERKIVRGWTGSNVADVVSFWVRHGCHTHELTATLAGCIRPVQDRVKEQPDSMLRMLPWDQDKFVSLYCRTPVWWALICYWNWTRSTGLHSLDFVLRRWGEVLLNKSWGVQWRCSSNLVCCLVLWFLSDKPARYQIHLKIPCLYLFLLNEEAWKKNHPHCSNPTLESQSYAQESSGQSYACESCAHLMAVGGRRRMGFLLCCGPW